MPTAHSLDKDLLDSSGRMRLLSADFYHRIDPTTLTTWANLRGRYVFPTLELVEWLRERIRDRAAIEIGAGFGDVGRHVPVPMTDSAMQQRPEMLLYYRSLGQVPIDPPRDVERIDGVAAVRKHRPAVVLACFVTQQFVDGDTENRIGSSMYGVDEREVISGSEQYIHVGNSNVHGDKRVLDLPHEEIHAPWLVTRANDQSKNVIYVWRKSEAMFTINRKVMGWKNVDD